MRQWTRLFYAGLIFSTFMGRFPQESDLAAPSADEFARGAAEGRFKPGEPETMRLLGKACLARFMAGLSEPGFDAALKIARQG